MPNQKQSVKSFFSRMPIQLSLFNIINTLFITIGPVNIKVSKTQISFANRRQFAWVWLPLPWDKRRPANSIVLSLALPKRLKDRQIIQAVQPYPGKWMHDVIIQKESDINNKVRKWLKQAYDFAQQKKF